MKPFKAFRIDSLNGEIRSRFETVTLDLMTPGEVVIKAIFSGINYKDALAATGKGRILQKYPLVGGIDVSGYVESSTDDRFKPGDPVLVCGAGLSETLDGGYAEFVRTPADGIVPLPERLTLFEAMAIGSAGFTAALALERLQLIGQTPKLGPIVVTGASGGVGGFAIDLLSKSGYEVVAITGKRKCVDYLKSLGASKVLFHQELVFGNKPLEQGLWGGAVDSVGGDLLSWLIRTVKPMGNIAVIGLAGGMGIHSTVMPFILRGISLLGINSVICPRSLRDRAWRRLATDLKPRHIDKIVTAQIPFSELPNWFERFLNREITGRTVVKIRELNY